jgi:hypothetical protein
MAALYAHGLPYRRRAVRVARVGAGLVVSAGAGTLAAGSGVGTVAAIAGVAGVGAFLFRWLAVPPPGALMPVFVCATVSQIPAASAPLLPRLGLVALGAVVAWLIVMARAPFHRGSSGAPTAGPPAPAAPAVPVDQALRTAARVSLGTAAAALTALAVGLPRPDWAAVACAAVLVLEGSRATLRRVRHRAVGTAAGITVAAVALALDPGPLTLVALVVLLQFAVELTVVRSYTVAVALLTPLALLQGTLATGLLAGPVTPLLTTRLVETALGCALALLAQAAVPARGERPVRAVALRLARRRSPAFP